MTTTDTPSVAPAAVVVPTRGSVAAAAVAVYLGGYLLIQSLTGQLATALSGYGPGPDVLTLFIGQLVFALVVTIVGFFLAPATTSRKLIASAIVVLGVIVTVVTQVARLTSGFGGIPGAMTIANPYFMVVLTAGAGWLIVRFARLGWLALLLTLILLPLPFVFAYAGLPSVFTLIVMLVLSGAVGAGILIAGRPWHRVIVPTAA